MAISVIECPTAIEAMATSAAEPIVEADGRLHAIPAGAARDPARLAAAMTRGAGYEVEAWAVEGPRVLAVRDATLMMVDERGERRAGPLPEIAEPTLALALAPGFAAALAVTEDPADPDLGGTRLVFLEPLSGRAAAVPASSAHASRALASTRAGFAVLEGEGALWLVAGPQPARTAAPAPWPEAQAWHPAIAASADGRWLAVVRIADEGDASVWVAEVAPAGLAWAPGPALRRDRIGALAWRPDGGALLATGATGGRNTATVVAPDGAVAAELDLPSIWFGETAAWSGDGARAYAADGPVLAILE